MSLQRKSVYLSVALVIALGLLTLLAASPTLARMPEWARFGLPPGEIFPGETWVYASSPEALGWSSEKLAKAQATSEKIGSAAVMIVDNGIVVDAWGDIDRKYQCHSMRKSLLSALYGIYVAEGAIDLDKTLADLGIDDKTPLTEVEKKATVADLLKARSGVYLPAAGEVPEMRAARPERGSHPPGTFWYYNNWDFNALGTIFDQETGEEDIYQAFKKRIADPIGMQDYNPSALYYSYEGTSKHPYYGFRMSTQDLARFGLLFLREGRWEGRQVVPAAWVRESTVAYSETGPESGYGYMWWTGTGGGLFPGVQVKGHSYYAAGYKAHLVIVLPYRNLVIVHREDTDQPNPPPIAPAQIGALLWRILDAAGETGIGPSPFLDRATGVHLTGDALQQAMMRSTLRQATPIGEASISFEEGGKLSVALDGEPVDAGAWWVEEGQLCVDFANPTADEGCISIVKDGKTIKVFGSDGFLLGEYGYSQE